MSFVSADLSIEKWMEQFAIQYGYLGIFIVSLIGAVSIVFPIPYTLLIFTMGHILEPSLVAIAGGLGSSLGEFSGYVLGYYGRVAISEERRRKMDYMLKIFDRYGAVTIFLFALTPLPDDLLFIPLGIMRYKFIKAFIPCAIGKLLMCFILAYGGRFSIEIIRSYIGEEGPLTMIATIIFLIIIMVLMLKIDWEKVFTKYIEKSGGSGKGRG